MGPTSGLRLIVDADVRSSLLSRPISRRFRFREGPTSIQNLGARPIGEAYLDVTDNLKGIPTAWETAKEIRARIYDETRLTASAGISCNKFLAKLASDYRKPNGQFAILPDQAEAFVATLPVAKFHGVGPKTTSKMRALGIETGADLRRQPSISCRTASASQGVFTTTSREVGTNARSNLTENESRRDRRRRSRRTGLIQFKSRPV